MSFLNWLFDRPWKRRQVPRASLAGGGEIALTAMVSEEDEGEASNRPPEDPEQGQDAGQETRAPDGEDTSGQETHAPEEDDSSGREPPPPDDEDEETSDDEPTSSDEPESDDDDSELAPAEEAFERHTAPIIGQPGLLPIELKYLDDLIRYRIGQVLHPHLHKMQPPMPSVETWQLPIGQFIIDYNKSNPTKLTDDDARLLLIALVDHVQPELFDYSIHVSLNGEGDFQPIGGTRGKNFRGFIPTGQTAVFLLGGIHWERDLRYQKLFWADHVFSRNKILWLGDVEQGEPTLSGKLILSQDYVDILLHNKVVAPHHNINFPAKLISTTRERDELVINDQLKGDFQHVLDWVKHKKEVEKKWADGKKGYRCLFHGPSGTGKTFATCMLGKVTGREVYRIDLSLVVSKFIGETEKNLELIFARAENKDWILFFDEADALFGKRTNIRDAHDKYANQEASYLLQRIEDYDGLVVLATNMKNNIDDSFLRRFDSDLKFSMPGMEDRRKIWKNSFPKDAVFATEERPAATGTAASATAAAATTGSATAGSGAAGTVTAAATAAAAMAASDKPAPPAEKRQFYRYVHRRDDENAAPAASVAPPRSLDIPDIVKGYALSGGNIQNVVHYATIRATTRRLNAEAPLVIYLEDVQNGIKRELSKNGIPFTNKKRNAWDNQQQD